MDEKPSELIISKNQKMSIIVILLIYPLQVLLLAPVRVECKNG